MNTLIIELRKEKRTGVIPLLLLVGVLGAAYAFVNFIVRKDTLLNLPLAPMDVLLTQLYGMIMVLNMFGIVVAACMVYNMEFKGTAIKKMYMLPISVPKMYLCKFFLLTVLLLTAIVLQNLALLRIGISDLPKGTFEMDTLLIFTAYSFITSMPTLSFMVLVSSRFENMWMPLGIGVRISKRNGLRRFKCQFAISSPIRCDVKACCCYERSARQWNSYYIYGRNIFAFRNRLMDGETFTL